jgi:hypothetical protein
MTLDVPRRFWIGRLLALGVVPFGRLAWCRLLAGMPGRHRGGLPTALGAGWARGARVAGMSWPWWRP